VAERKLDLERNRSLAVVLRPAKVGTRRSRGKQMNGRLECVESMTDPEARIWRVNGKIRRVRLRLYKVRLRAWWFAFQQWHRLRKRCGFLPAASERRLVVGVGMHRTGTRSLCMYLRSLGLKDVHWPWWCDRQVSRRVDDPEEVVDILEPLLYKYDCFADLPFPGLYRVLDRRFPNSRFILVRRDPLRWWRSVKRHLELEKGAYRLHPFEEVVYRQYEPSDMSLIRADDEQSLISKFERHSAEVQAYFDGREDKLLVLDLEDDRISERISEFLGMRVQAYPHESRH
jgi:hypothetical protein